VDDLLEGRAGGDELALDHLKRLFRQVRLHQVKDGEEVDVCPRQLLEET